MPPERRGLRSDAERTAHTILEAAERLLARSPTATAAQIAEAAGVSRTTVHRRFPNREALLDAMAASALRELKEAVEAADVEAAPPLVALHQVTVNVLRVKLGRRIAFHHLSPANETAAALQADLARMSDKWFTRMHQSGAIEAEPTWARRAYYALVNEAFQDTETDPHTLAEQVVRTFLHGVAPHHPI